MSLSPKNAITRRSFTQAVGSVLWLTGCAASSEAALNPGAADGDSGTRGETARGGGIPPDGSTGGSTGGLHDSGAQPEAGRLYDDGSDAQAEHASKGRPDSAVARDAGSRRSGSGADAGGLKDAPLTCGELTATNIEGPFFLSGSPERSDLRAIAGGGVPLEVAGRVLGPDCLPLEGALVDFWQADKNGVYKDSFAGLRGHQRTDAAGRYRLLTVVPGRYLNGAQFRPAHLHVKVAARKSGQLLTTQLYFPGGPYNAVDPFVDPALIMDVDTASPAWRARFEFVVLPD